MSAIDPNNKRSLIRLRELSHQHVKKKIRRNGLRVGDISTESIESSQKGRLPLTYRILRIMMDEYLINEELMGKVEQEET